MAELKWFGHACVHIRAREGTIMMDPVPRSLGYRFSKQRADIVTLSHEHPGHTETDVVSTPFKLINGPGEYEINEIFITGIRTYHDDQRGAEHGKNTSYVVEVEGMTICHLGDLGHELTDEQAEALASVDVLLIPVGGGPVLNAEVASRVVGKVEPRFVIPLQYRTEYGDKDRDELDRFLREMAAGEVETVERFNLRKTDVGDTAETEVVVLECSASGA